MLGQIRALRSLYGVGGFRWIQELVKARVQLVKFDHFVRNIAW